MFLLLIKEASSVRQCWTPLQLNCKKAPPEGCVGVVPPPPPPMFPPAPPLPPLPEEPTIRGFNGAGGDGGTGAGDTGGRWAGTGEGMVGLGEGGVKMAIPMLPTASLSLQPLHHNLKELPKGEFL